MSQFTVQDVVQDAASYVNQDQTLPESTELEVFVRYADLAQQEWSEAYSWDTLKKTSYITDTGGSLNAYFNRMLSDVYDQTTDPDTLYPLIDAKDRYLKIGTDKYAYLMGDPQAGYTLTVNAASQASLHFDWKAFPTSLATLSDIPTCPSREYLTKRVIGFVLESRSDTRFPQVKADAQLILNRMVANQDINKRQIGDWTRKGGYNIGEA